MLLSRHIQQQNNSEVILCCRVQESSVAVVGRVDLQLWNLITEVSNPRHGQKTRGGFVSWRLDGKNNCHKDKSVRTQLQA
jgi:hypothetical protein